MQNKIEVRRDYLLDRYAIISTSRGVRPKQYRPNNLQDEVKKCNFCPGYEEPELEIGRLERNHKWIVRWIKNKYPGVDPSLPPGLKSQAHRVFGAGFGYHEVVIDSPDHTKPLFSHSEPHITTVFGVYQQRYRALEAKRGVQYVCLFKNFGPKSGASLVHDHTQMVAQGFMPSNVKAKLEGAKAYKDCAICEILKSELRSKRKVASDTHWAAFTAYAPRFSNELVVFPKRHVKGFQELNSRELQSLAKLMKYLVPKVLRLSDSYNLLFFNSPSNTLHFHIELLPRTSTWAGYEFLTGNFLVSASPEVSAQYYKNDKG
jgi:UDPglucose--hexose-1-phosphate uridylyltransferase